MMPLIWKPRWHQGISATLILYLVSQKSRHTPQITVLRYSHWSSFRDFLTAQVTDICSCQQARSGSIKLGLFFSGEKCLSCELYKIIYSSVPNGGSQKAWLMRYPYPMLCTHPIRKRIHNVPISAQQSVLQLVAKISWSVCQYNSSIFACVKFNCHI